jgi:mono/diheme cytochrome c family protein
MALGVGSRRWLFALLTAVCAFWYAGDARSQSKLSPGYAEGDKALSPSERAGREIWFYATAFNDRFYTYSYPQRLGAAIDWYLVLAAGNKADLFQAWGAIPDPDCCVPGVGNCPAKSLDETYGFQFCPGDAELLKFVGKEGYKDPACDIADAPFNTSTPHGSTDNRQSACDLRFGTSTGALGLRKFPNPRFDAEKWKKLNGSLASWDKYRLPMSDKAESADSRNTRLFDGSVEPPFRIGMACGACHISYNPAKPPTDPNAPKWENIDGLVGNQYSRISQLLGSGMSHDLLEWQLIARSRPGTVDTSALPMDTVSNPGTMNAIINFASRPTHEHRVLKWRKASSCPGGEAKCWCEPAKANKCWSQSEKTERVAHILKGGEDTIGYQEAVQRVYFNIGSCAEQCWLNHVPDLRAIDNTQRNYGQTPFDIGQCRRDCASFRAIEDRLDDVVNFLLTGRPAELWQARGLPDARALEAQLDQEFGEGSVALGRTVFTATCASCHSSQALPDDPSKTVDFRATDPKDPTLRIDFLSAARPVKASEIGTYSARAMHSNHMANRVWDQYAARDLHERAADPKLNEIMKGGGRGYYRPPSLLSLWAYAPFMHNNGIGPEVCGKPSKGELDFYSSPYVDAGGKPLANPPACQPYDVSVEGRYKLFKASMNELLNPKARINKLFLTDRDIVFDVAPNMKIGDITTGLSIVVPKGFPAALVNSLRYKDLIQDLVLVKRDATKLDAKYKGIMTEAQLVDLKKGLDSTLLPALTGAPPGKIVVNITAPQNEFIQRYYSNVLGHSENSGHTEGQDLSERDKQALIAFLATL